jgi:molybdate transport system ATP-binding protein
VSLTFDAAVRERGFDVGLSLNDGETLAVLGPNGAGKSTLLGVIAGLVRPDSGRAVLDGAVLFDSSQRSRWRAPHERGISLLAQEALLFPHLSVRENVAFGPRSRRRGRLGASGAGQLADHWLAEVDAADLASRRPAQLSGGQAQRIAVARALASDPRLLLLDEPLSALDVAVASALRRMLRRVLEGRTAIIVTHDILDAFTLADRVVVMDGGRIVDSGPTRAVLDRPSNEFTAGLAGLDLLTGTASHGTSLDRYGSIVTDRGVTVVALIDGPLPPGGRAAVAVRPSAVSVATEVPASVAGRNVVSGAVLDLEPRGDVVRVRTEAISADLTPGTVAALDLAPGTAVWCTFAAADAIAYSVAATHQHQVRSALPTVQSRD